LKIIKFILISVILSLCTHVYNSFGQKEENSQQLNFSILTKADASVERTKFLAENDSLRPIFHVTAASRFINDPNGPVYFKGEYHIFFQHLPFWGDSIKNRPVWGHSVSNDMVHWRHLPIALAPTPGTYDAEAIASGCCVIHNGNPVIIYSGVPPQSQCLALSTDNLRTWKKDLANPVIAAPPQFSGLGDGFRDPFAWREGNSWRLIVGSAIHGIGGTVLLYQSDDLHNWQFIGPLCTGMGESCIQWECPNFIQFGSKHVLIVSPLYRDQTGLRGMVEYAVGNYNNDRFIYDHWQSIDLGGPTVYYAPNSFEDPHGRRILWGWIMANRPPSAGWSNCLSLPRVITLATDGTIRYKVLPELELLRYDKHTFGNRVIESDTELILDIEIGMHYEVKIEVDISKASEFELRIGRKKDGSSFIPIVYNRMAGKLEFGDKNADFHLDSNESILFIHLFIDGNVGEAYFNDKACFSNVLSLNRKDTGLSVIVHGGRTRIKRMVICKMNSIWQDNI